MPDALTPTQQFTAAAALTMTVTDDTGRVLTVRRMRVSDRLRFVKIIPPELQGNPLWTANAMAIASVMDVDGVPMPPLTGEATVEQAGDFLGDAGLDAANAALTKMLPPAKLKGALAAAGE